MLAVGRAEGGWEREKSQPMVPWRDGETGQGAGEGKREKQGRVTMRNGRACAWLPTIGTPRAVVI